MSDSSDSAKLAALAAEINSLHRENNRRDSDIESIASDVKHLLELANKSKGGLWVGMTIISVFSGVAGSVITWVASHVSIK